MVVDNDNEENKKKPDTKFKINVLTGFSLENDTVSIFSYHSFFFYTNF